MAPTTQLKITDSRTDKAAPIAITDGAIRASDLKQFNTGGDDPGLMSYDPAFLNTASCRSAITFIDGDKGILRYRGYPIEQLAEKATFLEVAWLLRHGELPTQKEYDQWVHDITFHTYVHENIKSFVQGFRYDAHPMSMLCSTVAALSAFYPSAKDIFDPVERDISIVRLMAKVPTLAAFTYRHVKGMPFVYPDNDLPYCENFLSMVARMSEPKYEARPVFAKAIEVLFILHADHEQNCSTNAVRAVGSIARGSVLGGRGGDRGAVRAAARRRERAGAAHDRGDRASEERAGVHRRGEEREGAAAHGLRPPRVQELRPAREDREEAGRRCVQGGRASTRTWRSRWSWSGSR